MTRSIRSMRHSFVMMVSMLVVMLVVPAVAAAQSINPTDEEYGPGIVGAAGGGAPADPGGISALPFTGLDVVAIAAIGLGLVGAGLVVRRASQSRTNTV